MNCEIIKDLIPLYIDKCCSVESSEEVEKHIEYCTECKKIFDSMNDCTVEGDAESFKPSVFKKVNTWKASVLQSLLLFISFGMITVGVALEARTPFVDLMNGFWAFNLVIPATGLMLSLSNWYFIRLYKSRKVFSWCSLLITLCITLLCFVWAFFHYNIFLFGLVTSVVNGEINFFALTGGFFFAGGVMLTAVFCVISKVLSGVYAKMLGKE